MKFGKSAVIGLGALAVVGVSIPGSAASGNKFDRHSVTRDCGGSDTVTWNGALFLWPPNHKLQDASVTATDGGADNGSDQTSVAVTPTIKDVAGGDGGPNHDPDFIYTTDEVPTGSPSATVGFQLRSERSGKGEGRLYTIDWKATFDNGAKVCQSPADGAAFEVLVPHDMRNKADYS